MKGKAFLYSQSSSPPKKQKTEFLPSALGTSPSTNSFDGTSPSHSSSSSSSSSFSSSSSSSPRTADSSFTSYAGLRQHVILSSMAAASSFSESAREGYRVDGLIASLVSAYLAPVPLHLVLRHPTKWSVQLKVDEKPHPTAMFHHLSWITDNVDKRIPRVPSPSRSQMGTGEDEEEEEQKGQWVQDNFSQSDCDSHRAHTVECCQRLLRELRMRQNEYSLYVHKTEWHMLGCIEGERLLGSPQLRFISRYGQLSSQSSPPLPFSPPFFAFTERPRAPSEWELQMDIQRLNSYAELRLFLLFHRQRLSQMTGEEQIWNLSLPPTFTPSDLQAFALELSDHMTLELFSSAIRLDISAAANKKEEKEAERWREEMERKEKLEWHHFTPTPFKPPPPPPQPFPIIYGWQEIMGRGNEEVNEEDEEDEENQADRSGEEEEEGDQDVGGGEGDEEGEGEEEG